MTLGAPWALTLELVLAALVVWRERFSTRHEARLAFPALAEARRSGVSPRARWARLPAALAYIGLALAIVALARPQSLLKGEEARARGVDIMIALDTSGSMRALDFGKEDRMIVAKRATKAFISHRQVDRLGLVVYGGVALLQCPLTLDYAALLNFLDDVEVGMTQTENTAIGTAIASAASRLKRSTAKSKIIILVTDGRSNAGEIDPLTAARAAAGLGIRIYAIGVGIRGQSVIPVETAWGRQLVPIQEDLDEPGLEQIARATEGRYYRAASAKDLEAIYGEIDQLEKTELKGPSTRSYEDRYLPWLLAAMVFLVAGLVLQKTVWRGGL